MALNLFKKKKIETEEIRTATIEKREDKVFLEESNQNYLKSPANTPPPTIIDIDLTKNEIKKKKIRFKVLLYTVLFSLFLLIFGEPIIKFYKENFLKQEPVVIEEPDELTPEDKPIVTDPESIVEYRNDELKITLDRLYKTSLFENTEEIDKTKKIEIIFDKNNPGKNISVEELTEGYIFRVSVFSTTLRKIDEISQVKKESFIVSCPKTATLTDTTITEVNGVEGRTFEVNNCGSDFKVTYVVKNGLNYEFSQIFKGDLGFRQAYKAETENILRSIDFYPEAPIDLGPLETYKNEDLKFSFDFPRTLSKDCCKANGPASTLSEFLFTVGDTETYVNENNFDAVTIYKDTYKIIDYDNYLENQKNLLIDDYVITIGNQPNPEVREMQIGGRNATMLKGHSWRGNDLIYIDISKENKPNVILVISIKNLSGESFDNAVKIILESFKFF